MSDRRFRQSDRVKHSDDFTHIIHRGAFAADDVLVINIRRQAADASCPPAEDPRPLAPSRLGISIPKKTGPAVVRNRWKRWIREAFRLQRPRIPGGLDIIVRPKRGAVGSFAAISRSLPSGVRRAQRRLESLGGPS